VTPESRSPSTRTAPVSMPVTAWHYRLAEVSPEDLPMTAAHALARGLDTPALCELAGLPRNADSSQVRNLFEQALEELGIPLPDLELAQRYRLHRLARTLLHETIDPAVLARDDWHEIPTATAEESSFVALLPPCSCCLEYTVGSDMRRWTAELQAAALRLTMTPPIGPDS
jgi:hypothetical protein